MCTRDVKIGGEFQGVRVSTVWKNYNNFLTYTMEFTDPVLNQQETPDKSQEGDNGTKLQTQDAIERLEGEIDAAYSMIESKFSSLWANASQSAQGIQEKVNFENRKKDLINQMNNARQNINNSKVVQENVESIERQLKDLGDHVKSLEPNIDIKSLSSQANKALDSLDSKLEMVEQQAGKFVSLFASFFSNIITIDNPKEAPNEEEGPVLSLKLPGAAYNSTRFDTDLFKLHTSDSFYLDEAPDDKGCSVFDIENKTDEISELLRKYPDTLEKTMNRLVPVQISYQQFWYRYYKQELKLKENEQSRKELLAKNEDGKRLSVEHFSDDDEEENFTWDDDDDEDDEEEQVDEDGGDDEEEKVEVEGESH